jgi:hypothetical protein
MPRKEPSVRAQIIAVLILLSLTIFALSLMGCPDFSNWDSKAEDVDSSIVTSDDSFILMDFPPPLVPVLNLKVESDAIAYRFKMEDGDCEWGHCVDYSEFIIESAEEGVSVLITCPNGKEVDVLRMSNYLRLRCPK